MPDITFRFSPDYLLISYRLLITYPVTYWVKSAWKEVTSEIIKHCFEKCGFPCSFM